MMLRHLLLMMLSCHLLLMMLSIHLLLMVHRLLPMSRAFVLDSFFVGAGLVSINGVIVAVKFSPSVFVPVILGPKGPIHSSLTAMFSGYSLACFHLFPSCSGTALPLRPRVPGRLCLGQRLRFC